jgi:Secretion system C-terminal sorting domain
MRTLFKIQKFTLILLLLCCYSLCAQIYPSSGNSDTPLNEPYQPPFKGPYVKFPVSLQPFIQEKNYILYNSGAEDNYPIQKYKIRFFNVYSTIGQSSIVQYAEIETNNDYFRLCDVTFTDPFTNTIIYPVGSCRLAIKTMRNGVWQKWGNVSGIPINVYKGYKAPQIYNSNNPSVPCGGTFATRSNGQIAATFNLSPYGHHWRITRPGANGVVEFDKYTSYFAFHRVDNPGTANDLNLDIFPAGFILPNTTYTFELAAHYPDGTNSQYFANCTFTTTNYALRIASTGGDLAFARELGQDIFAAQAYPNPSTSNFTINVQSLGNEKINMVVYNSFGQLIENKTLAIDFPSQDIGANYNKGFYTVIVSQGDNVEKIKLVKQ